MYKLLIKCVVYNWMGVFYDILYTQTTQWCHPVSETGTNAEAFYCQYMKTEQCGSLSW